jgi:hypothetical protein
MAQEVELQRLLGKCVRDANGRSIGRIEEVRAEPHGSEFVVTRYLLGPYGALERLSATIAGNALLSRLLPDRLTKGRSLAWDELDISDPDNLRLT